MRFRIGNRNPVFFHRSVRTDQSRGTDRPLDRFALSILARTPSAVGLHGLDLGIGKKHKGQIELGDKLIVGVDAVSAHADDDGICLGNWFDSVAEPARFFGSTRGVVLGIKP